LDGVNLDIRAGEVVGLAGENGAGKSTLVRCLAGDVLPSSGAVLVRGQTLQADPRSAARLGVAVVWQDLALCDNLDVASNLLLGRETRRMMFSATRLYGQAANLLNGLGISLPDAAAPVGTLSGGQRQLVAVARAMRDRPQLLILDEPTASLGVFESAQVEKLMSALPGQGTTVLLVSHDVEQMFRLANRIVVLRHGRVVGEVRPADSHPDDVAALLSGQALDGSARRQLSRLQGLADQLASAEPSSGLSLILSTLGAALDDGPLCIHVREGTVLNLVGATGIPRRVADVWQTVPVGVAAGQVGRAAATGEVVVGAELEGPKFWGQWGQDIKLAGIRGAWSVPFTGTSGVTGVITAFRRQPGRPTRDELDLVMLYAGYAASALERDGLLRELTVRNSLLETIREVLETLAGPVPLTDGLEVALRSLRGGLGADEVGLIVSGAERGPSINGIGASGPVCRGLARADGEVEASEELLRTAAKAIEHGTGEPVRAYPAGDGRGWHLAVAFPAPEGHAALVARWARGRPDQQDLVEDAANSLRLALEREASERVHREAMALRSSQELQRKFLSWLSHELRTPLTAIRGYASSLLQPDVRWDGPSQRRFLGRISGESARLGRLVDDLLDFSAIDSGILKLHRDWCDLPLILEAARACLPAPTSGQVSLHVPASFPVVWADHDRLEQVFVNLLDNAVRHNPPGTRVHVEPLDAAEGWVAIAVTDDGNGLEAGVTIANFPVRGDHRSRTAGAGLGLSIAKGIVDAHGGRLSIEAGDVGTRCVATLPVALGAPTTDLAADHEVERG
jgi:signal transduction histidine kinase/ABC-type multidrug transport system ATPase subunit